MNNLKGNLREFVRAVGFIGIIGLIVGLFVKASMLLTSDTGVNWILSIVLVLGFLVFLGAALEKWDSLWEDK